MLSERWLKLREGDPDLAPATWTGNRCHFENHIWPDFGADSVAGLPFEGKRLAAWVRALKKHRAGSTTRNVLSTFRKFLDWCRSPESGALIAQNPLRDDWLIDLLRKKKQRDSRSERFMETPLSVEQVQQLIDNPNVPVNRRVRYVLVFTSMPSRDGELSHKIGAGKTT